MNLDLEDDEYEIWMLQCPKSIDVTSLINCRLGKSHQSVEFDAEKFECSKTLMLIKPEKADEYEAVCDNVKIVSACYSALSASYKFKTFHTSLHRFGRLEK